MFAYTTQHVEHMQLLIHMRPVLASIESNVNSVQMQAAKNLCDTRMIAEYSSIACKAHVAFCNYIYQS